MLSGGAAIVSLVLVIATLGLYCVFRPHSSPNRALVEPRLKALQEPFRIVKSYYYFDGGSVGITIEDAKGAKEEFAIKGHIGSSEERYKSVFVGGDYWSRPSAVPVEHPEATKQALILILSRYSRGDPALDWARYSLSEGTSGRWAVWWHGWKGAYRPPPGSMKPLYSSKE